MIARKKGFTLVELLVVMGIILILAGIAVPAVNGARMKAKNLEVQSGCNSIQTALEQFAVDHGGNYPGTQWIEDSTGVWSVGPGVIGALPSVDGSGNERKDFYVPKVDTDPRNPYLADGTPDVNVLDALVVNGYIQDYPANPFLKASSETKSQMSNLFLFNPILGTTPPVVDNADSLDWNRYTEDDVESMRRQYVDFGRGHFSYIPLNPVNNTGFDYEGEWTSGSLSDAQLSGYYSRCRGYMLIGWGNSRLDDSYAKGMSTKYWNSTESGYDFDNSLTVDKLEDVLGDTTAGGILREEMVDSDGNFGKLGQVLPGGAPDIDDIFFGAAYLKISGS